MVGVHAAAIAAEVVQRQPFGDRSLVTLVVEVVGAVVLAVDNDVGVAVLGLRAGPDPAGGRVAAVLDPVAAVRIRVALVAVDVANRLALDVAAWLVAVAGDARLAATSALAEARRDLAARS